MSEETKQYEARHREAAEYLEQHKPVREAPLAGGFEGDIAERGLSLVKFTGSTIEGLVDAAKSEGIVSVAATVDGSYLVYIVGAPAFVNADFIAAFTGGIEAGHPFVVRRESHPRPSPSRPEDRGAEYLRSVVEQIHRDAHDALSAVPARPSEETALDELVERWLRYSKEAQDKPDSDYDRGRAFAYWIAADSLTAVLAAVQPPPRDPAGEGEEVCLCGHPGFDHVVPNSDPAFCSSCDGDDGIHDYFPASRPSSPTGETPGSVSATSDGRVAGNTPQLQSAPTGETRQGGGACARCGGRFIDVSVYFRPSGPEEWCIPQNDDDVPHKFVHPRPAAAVPEPPTVGYEAVVEGEWRREPGTEITNIEGIRTVAWRMEDGRWSYEYSVPLAVEQAIRAETEAWVEGEWKAWTAADADKLRAAEAERDRYREALRYASEQAHTYMGLIHARSFARCNQEPCITRRALAGESTGAGEGE